MGEIIVPTAAAGGTGNTKKFENPWQIQLKSLEEKWAHVFQNQLYTDTVVWAGSSAGPPVSVPCHKVILILHSPVFESMLSARWLSATATKHDSTTTSEAAPPVLQPTTKEEIHLPEDNPGIVKLLISCFYNGKPKTVEEALELLLLAKKYICTHVVTKCCQFLRTSSNERNIVQIYQTAYLVEEAELLKHTENYILSKACHLVRLGEFSHFNYEQLKYFLSHDDLNVDEVDLFNAVYRWGQLECTRKEMDAKAENISNVLEHIFPLIRFPCMSLEDFTVHVVSKNVLPLEQTVQVYKFLTTPVTKRDSICAELGSTSALNQIQTEKSEPVEPEIQFNTNARSRKIFSYIFKRLTGYGFNFGRKWQNFVFQVDHDIKMVSVGFYRAVKPNVEISVGVRIMNYDMTEVYGQVKDEPITCSLDEDVFYVKFPQLIRIAKDTQYTISYKIVGDDTLYKYGEPTQVTIACSSDLKLCFNFKEAITDTDLDQIPEFCFQL